MNHFNAMVENLLMNTFEWTEWYYDEPETVEIPGVCTVKFSMKKTFETDSYGDGPFGTVYLHFKVNFLDGVQKFFRKECYYSSYDGFTHDGPFQEVKPKVVEVIEYEVVD